MSVFLEGTSEIAKTVLAKRYLGRNDQGLVAETESGMYKRVANAVGKNDTQRDIFYKLMSDKVFMPNTPCLLNAGKPNGQLAACYVLPIEDSLESILTTAKNAALIHSKGGGVGFSFSHLRPRGDLVSNSNGISPGPIAFMEMYDAVTGVISQGGARRGANLGTLLVNHPDISEFIHCKLSGKLTNFNISVGITDEFMNAVKNDNYYELINPRNGCSVTSVRAKMIFDQIAECAWKCGDPGLLFIDTINRDSDEYIETTNPCGEIPLPPYGACVLGHINLNKYERKEKDERKNIVRECIRFLDKVLYINNYPLPEIREKCLQTKRIGLGVMGWADVLADKGIVYGSQYSYDLAEEIMSEILFYAQQSSEELGGGHSTLLTIAPTGTTSIIADCSSGIEPYFSLAFQRHIMDDVVSFETVKGLKIFLENFYGDNEAILDTICKNKGRWEDRGNFGAQHLITSQEIPYEDHIKMQAIFQKYIDNSVSKTINMDSQVTVNDIKNAYLMAYDLGCKGITVFRDGCKGAQVLTGGKK